MQESSKQADIRSFFPTLIEWLSAERSTGTGTVGISLAATIKEQNIRICLQFDKVSELEYIMRNYEKSPITGILNLLSIIGISALSDIGHSTDLVPPSFIGYRRDIGYRSIGYRRLDGIC